jgi:hypothetical protein
MAMPAEQGVSRLLLLALIGRLSTVRETTPRLAVINGAGNEDPTVDEKDE